MTMTGKEKETWFSTLTTPCLCLFCLQHPHHFFVWLTSTHCSGHSGYHHTGNISFSFHPHHRLSHGLFIAIFCPTALTTLFWNSSLRIRKQGQLLVPYFVLLKTLHWTHHLFTNIGLLREEYYCFKKILT